MRGPGSGIHRCAARPALQKDRNWKITVDLEPGREYQFRYLVDGQRWFNDPQADKYIPNPYGDQNAVVVA